MDKLETNFQIEPKEKEKILQYHEKISKQIDRGQTLIKKLNHFSHLSDEPLLNLNFTKALQEFIFLLEYKSKKNDIRLLLEQNTEEVWLFPNYIKLFHLLFEILLFLFDKLPKSSEIKLSIKNTDVTCLVIQFRADTIIYNEITSYLNQLIKEFLPYSLDVTIEKVSNETKSNFIIKIKILKEKGEI